MKKKYNGIMLLLAFVLTVTLSLSYAPEVRAAKSSGKVKSVTVTNLPSNTLTLKKGKSKTLKIKVTSTNKNKVSQKVTCKSSAPKVAAVTDAGKVTAKKNGTAKITITSTANTQKKTVITVKVGTPVTKITFDKASITMGVKESATVKATIEPSKATNKNLIWSSSNTKAATVNSQGKITSVKAGTANITATAADGSGVKKTVKVTVINRTKVSVSVVNGSTVKVSLSAAQKLSASNFTLKVKSERGKRYNKQCRLESVTTANNKDYLLTLDPSYKIRDRICVQVTVSGLPGGSSSGETICDEGVFTTYTRSMIKSGTVGKEINGDWIDGEGRGYHAFTVNGLPNGIKSETVHDRVEFYGKPSEKGSFTSTITSIDELGNTYTYSVIWMIRDKDGLNAAAAPVYYLLPPNGTVDISSEDQLGRTITVNVNGGSGDYEYSFEGENFGLSIDPSTGHISGTLKEAKVYDLKVKVVDKKTPAYTATADVVINVSEGVTISGNVVDVVGNPIPYAKVAFKNKDKTNKYTEYWSGIANDENCNYDWSGAVKANGKGIFSYVMPPGTYDVEVRCGIGSHYDTDYYGDGYTETIEARDYNVYSDQINHYLYDQDFSAAKGDYKITLPLRKVQIQSTDNRMPIDNKNIDSSFEWFDENGVKQGVGDTFYVKDGSKHKWTAVKEQATKKLTATVDFTADAQTQTTFLTVAEETPARPSIEISKPASVYLLENDDAYYTFKPGKAGKVYFYFKNISNSFAAALMDETGNNELRRRWIDDYDGDYVDGYGFAWTFSENDINKTFYLKIKTDERFAAADLYAAETAPTGDVYIYDPVDVEYPEDEAAVLSGEDIIEDTAGDPNEIWMAE